MKALLIAAALAAVAGSASAETYVQWPASASAGVGRATYFPQGTPLALRTRTDVSSDEQKTGDRFYLEVARSLTYRGQVVIPVGAVAVGEVVRARASSPAGLKGALEVQLLYVETPNGPIRLTGQAAGSFARPVPVTARRSPRPIANAPSFIARIPYGTVIGGSLGEPLRFAALPYSGEARLAAVRLDAVRPLSATFDPAAFGGVAGSR